MARDCAARSLDGTDLAALRVRGRPRGQRGGGEGAAGSGRPPCLRGGSGQGEQKAEGGLGEKTRARGLLGVGCGRAEAAVAPLAFLSLSCGVFPFFLTLSKLKPPRWSVTPRVARDAPQRRSLAQQPCPTDAVWFIFIYFLFFSGALSAEEEGRVQLW